MRLTQMHVKTLREVPSEAEIPSHVLLLRTGMIRKLVSGVYGFIIFSKDLPAVEIMDSEVLLYRRDS